jgi:NADPH:quinone reductase-like Zn-dependent oxidoreductase
MEDEPEEVRRGRASDNFYDCCAYFLASWVIVIAIAGTVCFFIVQIIKAHGG